MVKHFKILYQFGFLKPYSLFLLLKAIVKEGMNPMALLYYSSKSYPNNIAMNDSTNSISYKELYNDSELYAEKIDKLIPSSADSIGVISTTSLITVKTLFALFRLGKHVYLINKDLSEGQIQSVLFDNNIEVVFHDDIEWTQLGKSTMTFSMNELEVMVWDQTASFNSNINWRNTSRLTMFTGGSSGNIKQATRKTYARNFISPFISLINQLSLHQYSNVLLTLPLYHGFGIASLFVSMALGAKVSISSTRTVRDISTSVGDDKNIVLVAVPALLFKLKVELPGLYRQVGLIVSGGAPLTKELNQFLLQQTSAQLFNLYGTTEAGVLMIANTERLHLHLGTIGKPMDGVECKLINEFYKEEVLHGELLVRCQWSVDPSKWISTGDIVYKSQDGCYFVFGRKDNMIISGGENVFPEDLDFILQTHEDVLDSYSMGIEDDIYGQRLISFVVIKNNKVSTDELIIWLKIKAARFQQPKYIYMIHQLPYTATGKMDKKKLMMYVKGEKECLNNYSTL